MLCEGRAVTTPNKYSPQTNVLPPRCPYCSQDLTEIARYEWTAQIAMGMVIILAVHCPNAECRKLLQSQIMIVPHAQESAIVPPH